MGKLTEKELQTALAEQKNMFKEGSEAVAEIMTEYLPSNHITTDFVGMLLNSRRLKEGDVLVKKVRKGIKVRTLVPGSIHLKDELTVSERANYILDGADVGVQFNQWELESGELGTIQEIRGEMMAKLRDYYQNKVFTALTTVWDGTNTPNNYTAVASLTSAALKNAIDYMNQTVGGVRAVVGLRSLLTPVTTFGGFWSDGSSNFRVSDKQLQEIMDTGWLGRFYGAPIVALQQIYDNPEDYQAMLPTDKVLVIGENVGDFVTYGEPRYKEWVDNRPTPPYWNLEVYQRFGMIIDNAQGIYVIKITG